MFIIAGVLGAILLYTCFVKSWRKTHAPNALCVWLVSVLVDFLFDMQLSLILKIQSLSVWKSSCENFSLLAEAKCHTVWKMIVIFIRVIIRVSPEKKLAVVRASRIVYTIMIVLISCLTSHQQRVSSYL